MARARCGPDFCENINFGINQKGNLLKQLKTRADRPKLSEHQVAKRDLGRYYEAIPRTEIPITETEMEAVFKVMADTKPAFHMLWAELADAGHIKLALKIKKLDAWHLISLVDTLERRMNGSGH
jgi:hypothetical protein